MEFYQKLLPKLGFTCDRSDQTWGTFYSVGRDKPSALMSGFIIAESGRFIGMGLQPQHIQTPNVFASR